MFDIDVLHRMWNPWSPRGAIALRTSNREDDGKLVVEIADNGGGTPQPDRMGYGLVGLRSL